jgi:hypothetical protein
MSSFNEYIFALHLLSTVSFTQSSALLSQSNHPQTSSSDFCFFFFFFVGSQIPKHPLSGAAATTVEETHLGWRFDA